MNFRHLFDLYRNYEPFDRDALGVTEIDTQMHSEVETLVKQATGRKPKNLNKVEEILGAEKVKEINDKFSAMLKPRLEKRKANKKRAEAILESYAQIYEPQVSVELHKLSHSSGGDYHTQGYGCNKYAKGSLEEARLMLEMTGFKPEVREIPDPSGVDRWGICYYDYELWAYIDPFNYWILNHKHIGFTEMDYAVICWRNGVNPKVLFPFMDDDVFDRSMTLFRDSNYVVQLILPEERAAGIISAATPDPISEPPFPVQCPEPLAEPTPIFSENVVQLELFAI